MINVIGQLASPITMQLTAIPTIAHERRRIFGIESHRRTTPSF